MKKDIKLFKIFVYVVLVIFTLSIIVPVAWVFMSALKENKEFYGNPWAFPLGFYWENFKDAWTSANMGDYLLNSVIVTFSGLAILLIVSVPCAYILSRLEFKGKKFLKTFMKAGVFINLSYIVIPIFLLLLDLNKAFKITFFINNRLILAMIYAATSIPFTVYLLSNFFSTISKSYEEAARIDGAGYFRTMVDVILPMAKPAVITVILFNFLSFWNEYILALTLMPDQSKRTLPVGLINLQQAARGAANYGRLYAGMVLVMLPTLILYILVQKQLTEGMMVGGDK
ncbi:carbohydrate ABC transporter permease [Helcococcus kunzii]|uniref:carbohydrate ABC transporter permease n=1 Tax=Helcococcus kunzii TaxID=40091 RepID=UPI001BAFD50D|nr:carbohydrate ABC transporter permease [Helcococcus kunzii]QUY65391.1 carbohydrate ABC transporter permease [Helcococcus kunzii]QZO76065.1 carbohydrate ABC transporter permease [Helcococcus kunzii]